MFLEALFPHLHPHLCLDPFHPTSIPKRLASRCVLQHLMLFCSPPWGTGLSVEIVFLSCPLIQQAWKNCTKVFKKWEKNGGAGEMTTVTTQCFLHVWIMEQELCSWNWPLCHAWEAGHQEKMSPCGSLATWQLECLIALLGSYGFVWAHGQDKVRWCMFCEHIQQTPTPTLAWLITECQMCWEQTKKFRKNAPINV